MPHKTPVGVPINLDMGDGEVQTIKLVDNPMNRGMMAIKRHCGDDSERFFSASFALHGATELSTGTNAVSHISGKYRATSKLTK